MEALLSAAGLERLDAIARPGLLCAFDFDGTLSPIVQQPDQALLPEEVKQQLLGLAKHAPVAIITGRSVEDIRRRLGYEPDFLIGNHGLEGIPGREEQAAAHRSMCSGWRRQLEVALDGARFDPGIQLEDKRYSLSVHYRHASDPERAAEALRTLFDEIEPRPRIVGGKYVFNLVPEDGADKGKALEALIDGSGARSAVYVGDDVTDEDVFRLDRDDLLSVRIERATHSMADFYLPQAVDIMLMLRQLTERLASHGARNWLRDGD